MMILGHPRTKERQSERYPAMRPISYELYESCERTGEVRTQPGKALFLNISAGGMLLLMDQAPRVQQIMKLYVPSVISHVSTPTLVEVRWTRPSPSVPSNGTYLVGVRFMI